MTTKTMKLALLMFALLGIVFVMSASHATSGLGEDISKTGDTIEKTADDATPK